MITLEQDVQNKVKEIIAKIVEMDADKVDASADLSEHYGIESLRALEILVELERAFSMRIPESKLQHMRSVNKICQMIAELRESTLSETVA